MRTGLAVPGTRAVPSGSAPRVYSGSACAPAQTVSQVHPAVGPVGRQAVGDQEGQDDVAEVCRQACSRLRAVVDMDSQKVAVRLGE